MIRQSAERAERRGSFYPAIGAAAIHAAGQMQASTPTSRKRPVEPNDPGPCKICAESGSVRDLNANKIRDRAETDPDSLSLWSIKAQLAIGEKGSFEIAKRVVSNLTPEQAKTHLAGQAVQVLLLERKYAETVRAAESVSDDLLTKEPEGLPLKYMVIGIAKKLQGDEAGAREALLASKRFAEKYVNDAPKEAVRHSKFGVILAWLGEKEAAIAEGKRATEMLPENVDAFDGPKLTEELAEIYCIVGEHDKAIDLLDGLLSRPSFVTVASLKVLPNWDWLRNNPRFNEVLKKHGG